MSGTPTRALLLVVVATLALLSGCSVPFDTGPDTPGPTETDRSVVSTTEARSGQSPTEATTARPTTTAPPSATAVPITTSERSEATTRTPEPDTVESATTDESGTSTQTTEPFGAPADLQRVVLERRSLSEEYVPFGEVSRVGDELSAANRNNSVTEWHRRTFRRNASTDRPLLVTSSVREYTSEQTAKAALERKSEGPDSLNLTAERALLSEDTEVTVVRFRPASGTYGVTVLYQEGDLLLTLETLDPDQFYEGQARSYLLRMVGDLRTTTGE